MNKKRWNEIGEPVPVSKEYPCEPGDVVSHYGGFHLSLVLEVDEDGLPTAMTKMNGDVIVIDETSAAKDDGTLYHTDLAFTKEKWSRTAPYAFWKMNDDIHHRLWAEILKKGSSLAERWAADPVPFRVYRYGIWMTPQELAEKEKNGSNKRD